ncbi:MAG: EAL domain-containing protein [Treponema sp.]|nr:EAL domain-containing protein [Treponema sp.]
MTFVFAIVIPLFFLSISFVLYKTVRHITEYKMHYVSLLLFAVASAVAFSMFKVLTGEFGSFVWAGIYEFCQTWFLYFLFAFSAVYCSSRFAKIRVRILFIFLAIVDSIIILFNFAHPVFFTVQNFFIAPGVSSFVIEPGYLFYVHYTFIMIFIITSLIISCEHFIKTESVRKIKYLFLFIFLILMTFAYTFELFVFNHASVSSLFTFISGFFCYLSGFRVPRYITSKIISYVQENSNDAIICFDIAGHIVFKNSQADRIINGKKFPKRFSPEFLFDFFRQNWSKDMESAEWTCLLELDSKISWFDVSYRKVYKIDEFIGSFFKFRDVTVIHDEREEQKYNASHDPLTGILNRNGFLEEVDRVVAENPFCSYVMVCSNIKDFKLINSIFGKEAGNRVLVKIADLLKKNAHKTSIYGRISDDKFALLAEKESFTEDIFYQKLDKIQLVIENPVYRITFKIGIYEFKGTSESAEILIDKAVLALKTEKSPSMFSYFDRKLMEQIVKEKYLLNTFENQLMQKKFSLVFKPVSSRDGKIKGAKCSALWNDQKEKFSTTFVVNTLDKTGLIYKLDSAVWEEAFRTLSARKDLPEDFFVNLHISEKDFYYMDVPPFFAELSSRYGVSPSMVNIGVPEKILSKNFEKISENCLALKKAGFRILIEDFGSDYSSLNMLKNFSADIIEVDVRYFYENGNGKKASVILKSVARLAQSLGMTVIFSGVANDELLSLTDASGNVFFDGEYFSRPVSFEKLEKTFASGRQ